MTIINLLSQHFRDELDDGTYHPGHFDQAVRRCLISMREPSHAMIIAGAKKVRGGTGADCAAACWRAMVDVILQEAQPLAQEPAERQSS
jgi:hypothetical protein